MTLSSFKKCFATVFHVLVTDHIGTPSQILFEDLGCDRLSILDAVGSICQSPGIMSQFSEDDRANPCVMAVSCGGSGVTAMPFYNNDYVPGQPGQRTHVGGRE